MLKVEVKPRPARNSAREAKHWNVRLAQGRRRDGGGKPATGGDLAGYDKNKTRTVACDSLVNR